MRLLVTRTKELLLAPVDDHARDHFSHLTTDQVIYGEFVQNRNIKHHRKLFALIRNVILPNQELYLTERQVITALKIGTGHCEWIPNAETGELMPCVLSIDFTRMKQAEFAEFYSAALAFTARHIIKVADPQILENIILELM